MRIALFSDTFEKGYGGVTVYVRDLAKYLRKQKYDVKVFVWESENLTSKERETCVTFPAIDMIKTIKGKAGLCPLRLIKEIRKFNPDVIHNHSMFTMGLHAVLAAKKLKIPLINHYHTYLEQYLNHLPSVLKASEKIATYAIRKNTKFFFGSSNLIITPSQVMKKYLEKIGVKKKIKVVPFGIDLKKFSAAKEHQKFTVLHVGRLSKEKNICDIFPLFAEFAKRKNVVLKIVGEGCEQENLKKVVKQLRLTRKVKFLNWVSRNKLPRIYNSADVFITLSESETFGIVILEAMACGLPIIGIRATAVPELVTDKKNGFLINKNNKKHIVKKLNELFYDKNLRKKMAVNSLLFAQKYEENKVFRELERIYQEICAKKC